MLAQAGRPKFVLKHVVFVLKDGAGKSCLIVRAYALSCVLKLAAPVLKRAAGTGYPRNKLDVVNDWEPQGSTCKHTILLIPAGF